MRGLGLSTSKVTPGDEKGVIGFGTRPQPSNITALLASASASLSTAKTSAPKGNKGGSSTVAGGLTAAGAGPAVGLVGNASSTAPLPVLPATDNYVAVHIMVRCVIVGVDAVACGKCGDVGTCLPGAVLA